MKKKFWAHLLIGLFVIALLPVSVLVENEPPTWDPCLICPPTLTANPTTPPTATDPAPTDPTPTPPLITCPEKPPAGS